MFGALFAAAETWARDRGRERLLGPMDFTTNDECGLLIEGYDLHPLILQPWHPPYYQERIEARLRQGDGPADVEPRHGGAQTGRPFADAIHEVADKVESEHGITVRNIDKTGPRGRDRTFHGGLQRRLGRELGLRPGRRRRGRLPGQEPEQVIDENWCFIAERDGETLGAAFTMPDINQVTKGMNGRLLPFGWLKFLVGKAQDRPRPRIRPRRQARVPAHGIAARFYVRHIETAAEVGVSRRRDGLDPRGERADEPGDGGHGGDRRQALPAVRKDALSAPRRRADGVMIRN